MRDLISGVLRDHAEHPADFGVVAGYVAVVETVDPSGNAHLRLVTDDGVPVWRSLGLVEYAAQLLRDTAAQA